MQLTRRIDDPDHLGVKKARTDWQRIASMADEDIDTTDIPPLDEEFFANAELRLPRPKPGMAHQKPSRG